MIKFHNVVKQFNNNIILNKVSGEVQKGEVVALLGSSGSGKSTLLRCMNLLETPEQGSIIIDGVEILCKQCDIMSIRKEIGMVFQNFNLFSNMTVLQNITYSLYNVLHYSTEKANKVAISLLKQIDLSSVKNQYPFSLSGGQKQRVAIARSLAMNPKIMLFDEPTSALDPEMVNEVLDVIKKLVAKHNISMFIVTHEMQFAKEVADMIWFLDKGKIVEKSPPKEFFSSPKHERAKKFLSKIL